MVFSTPLFLFLFLPAVLTGYYLAPKRLRNGLLLAASLYFYAWGEGWVALVMLLSCLANYGFALWLTSRSTMRERRFVVGLSVGFNLGLLGIYKYADFVVLNLNLALDVLGLPPASPPGIALPIGISFFTFQALSYVLDVHRGDAEVQRNPIDFSLYITLFPQLIAGPIVRYHDIATQIRERTHREDKFFEGVQRFTFGLTKKMLVANTAAECADQIYSLPLEELTPGLAWLANLSYTVQIYFDFSGYSDMAIGLGLMFGFRYLENFRHPYVATSITEFWRRWHISLSSWFRDYLYVPLGGNRGGVAKTYRNLFVVFLLCGLWHGASWTFLVWGAYHGAFLVLERSNLGARLRAAPRAVRHVYTLLVVIAGWVLFRSTSFEQALAMLAAMIGLSDATGELHQARHYLDPELLTVLAAGAVFSMPLVPWIQRRSASALRECRNGLLRSCDALLIQPGQLLLLCALLVLCASKMAVGTYNPFIYFRF